MGLVNRLAPPGRALETAVALALELAALPQTCLRNDRRSVLWQWGLSEPDALVLEARFGLAHHRQRRDPAGRGALRLGGGPPRRPVDGASGAGAGSMNVGPTRRR